MASRENLHKKNHAKLWRKTIPEHLVHKLVKHRSPHEVTSCFNPRCDASKNASGFCLIGRCRANPTLCC